MKAISITVGSLVLFAIVAMAILMNDNAAPIPRPKQIPPVPRFDPPPPKDEVAPRVSADEERKQWAEEKSAREAALPKEEEILSISQSLSKPYYYDEIGKYWMSKLDDEKLHSNIRSNAARNLGILSYPPAVPILVKHIQLIDGWALYSDDYPNNTHVVKYSLGEYGNAAVPEIIEAYLDTADSSRRDFLQGAIESGNTHKVARIYLDGLHAQGDKRVTDKDLEFFHGLK